MRTSRVLFVFLGGFCGTVARYFASPPLAALAHHIFGSTAGPFPWDIFAINLLGAFALGLLYGLAERGARIPHEVRLLLGTGFLGAYTTFSTFAVGGDALLLSGNAIPALLYLVSSIALGVLCVHAGHQAAAIGMRLRPWPHTGSGKRQRHLAPAPPHTLRAPRPWVLPRRAPSHSHLDAHTHPPSSSGQHARVRPPTRS